MGLGTVKNVEVSLTMKPDAIPRFFHPRSVPFALKEAVGQDIDRLEATGILEKVEYSKWATPIVPVPNKDGNCIFVEIIKSLSIRTSKWINTHYQTQKKCLQPWLEERSSQN